MRTSACLCAVVVGLILSVRGQVVAQQSHPSGASVKATIVAIADRWVETWIDAEWDEAKGLFKFPQGPYADAFEHHYVAAVLINTRESKFYRHEKLTQRVVDDLLYYAKVFVEQCRDKGLRGYWTLNGAAAKGIPVGSGSWQSRSYIRACDLLDGAMKPEGQRAWREGAKWLMISLAVDWKENLGPWWSTNKVADHVAALAEWVHLSRDPQAQQYLDRQFDWFWGAFAAEGLADKYHNYFAKTLYRLAPVLFVPEASRYHRPLLDRAKMWRSFITVNGLYDAALHHEPNTEASWHAKLDPVAALLLLAARDDPELALVARQIVEKRLADYRSEGFMKRQFEMYFGGHWGSLGLIIESAPQWEPATEKAAAKRPGGFEEMLFFDYWQGLGRVAVKTPVYQASCYPHWAYTWDFARLGGILHRLTTPGVFHFPEPRQAKPRTDSARCWLDWDPHRDPETGQAPTGLVVAQTANETLSLPPNFPDEAIVSGLPGERLYGVTHCRYRLGDLLEVRTSNVFLSDAIIVLGTITALKDAELDALYVQLPLANPGDLTTVTAGGQTIEFVPDNVKPAPSVAHPVAGMFDLCSRGGSGALAGVPLANSFTKQELADLALWRAPVGDEKRVPHRVEAWRAYLPSRLERGDVLLADFALVPHAAAADFKPTFQVVRQDQMHGVVVPGTSRVIIGQSLRGPAEMTIGDVRAMGELFAVEVVADTARKVSLYGRSLAWRQKPLVSLSRQCAATLLPSAGSGTIDAGVGPIDVTILGKTHRVFSTNHEFPRMACISRKVETASESAAMESPPGAGPGDLARDCRRFAALPGRIEAAARLAELEVLRQAAEARGAQLAKAAELLTQAKQSLSAEDLAAAGALIAEAQKEVLALCAAANLHQTPAAVKAPDDGAPTRIPENYRISFAEEQGREALKQRAELLCRWAMGRPDEDKLCADVRAAEQALLTRYYGLPIRWIREHIPGQPDFFWRPVLAAAPARGTRENAAPPETAAPATEWEQVLLKYVHPGSRLALALARLEAANALIRE